MQIPAQNGAAAAQNGAATAPTKRVLILRDGLTHCNTLQHAATHCNTLVALRPRTQRADDAFATRRGRIYRALLRIYRALLRTHRALLRICFTLHVCVADDAGAKQRGSQALASPMWWVHRCQHRFRASRSQRGRKGTKTHHRNARGGRYEIYSQKSSTYSQKSPTCSQKSPIFFFKRALHILKRALHILKRALYILKRALHILKKRLYILLPHKYSVTSLRRSRRQKRWESHTYSQKSLICFQKSLIYFQKSPTYPQKSPADARSGRYETYSHVCSMQDIHL